MYTEKLTTISCEISLNIILSSIIFLFWNQMGFRWVIKQRNKIIDAIIIRSIEQEAELHFSCAGLRSLADTSLSKSLYIDCGQIHQ